jgi:myosin heavy subunit
MKILGATTENYLLEKIRVVDPSKNERSFHIFYALLHYMPPS